MSSHIKKLWSNKTIMFVNEISMMNLSMLNKINNQCKITKFLNKNFFNLFDELSIIIFMKDFYQFSFIKKSALWKESRKNNDENANNQIIWYWFTEIVMLNQQMKQMQNFMFQNLLNWARNAVLTENNLILLNQKMIKFIFISELKNVIIVIKLNIFWYHINHFYMKHFV